MAHKTITATVEQLDTAIEAWLIELSDTSADHEYVLQSATVLRTEIRSEEIDVGWGRILLPPKQVPYVTVLCVARSTS